VGRAPSANAARWLTGAPGGQPSGVRRFADRAQAGRLLGAWLAHELGGEDVLVLGLPRGGVPVAAGVAAALGAPLDALLVRKLGVPGHEELAFGALASGGTCVLNDGIVDTLGVDEEEIAAVVARESRELARRERRYRGGRAPPRVAGRRVMLVDDGLATGASMRAGVATLRAADAATIVAVAPVGTREACDQLAQEADAVRCPLRPEPFMAVGRWYADFAEVPDDVVAELLAGAPSGASA